MTWSKPKNRPDPFPDEIPLGSVRLVVTVSGQAGALAVFPVTAAAPGIFYSSNNQAAVQNQDFSANSETRPAAPGSIVVAYLTGQGKLDLAVPTGSAAPTEHLSHPVATVKAMFDDQPAEVLFAGMAPGMIGVMQVNVRVPALDDGEAMLKITVGGAPSNLAAVFVKQAAASGAQ